MKRSGSAGSVFTTGNISIPPDLESPLTVGRSRICGIDQGGFRCLSLEASAHRWVWWHLDISTQRPPSPSTLSTHAFTKASQEGLQLWALQDILLRIISAVSKAPLRGMGEEAKGLIRFWRERERESELVNLRTTWYFFSWQAGTCNEEATCIQTTKVVMVIVWYMHRYVSVSCSSSSLTLLGATRSNPKSDPAQTK